MPATWARLRHAHVAAIGALLIDLAAFNLVVWSTGIIPIAQFAGATSGSGFNFVYNQIRTFRRPARPAFEGGVS